MSKENFSKKSKIVKTQKKKAKTVGDFEDTFFLSFIGELVELAGSFYYGEQEAAIKMTGYILDINDEYYFLGDTPEEITSAVKRERVIYIQVLNPDNEYTKILDSLEIPEDDAFKN